MARKIYCHGEHERFSQKEFRHNPDGTLCNPKIHDTLNPHYAATGAPVKPPKIPGAYRKWAFARAAKPGRRLTVRVDSERVRTTDLTRKVGSLHQKRLIKGGPHE